MLFDPFEEEFDLPAASIQVGDGQGGQVEVVGQEHESALVFDVVERDASETSGVALRSVDAIEGDGRVAAKAGGFVDGSTFACGDDGVRFGADDEEGFGRFEAVESLEIEVAPVQDVEGSRVEGQIVEGVDVVQFSLGNVDETRNVAAEIDQGVEFDGAFATAEFRPGEEGQTEIDGGGIEGVHGLGQSGCERVVRVEGSGPTDQDVSEVGVNPPVVNAVGIGERAPRDGGAEAGVVAFVGHGPKTRFDVAKAFAEGEWGEGHGQELIAARESARTKVTAVAANAGVEFVTGQVVHQLREDELTRKHCGGPTIGNEHSEVDYDHGS